MVGGARLTRVRRSYGFACTGYDGDVITSYVTLHYVFHSNHTNIVCV